MPTTYVYLDPKEVEKLAAGEKVEIQVTNLIRSSEKLILLVDRTKKGVELIEREIRKVEASLHYAQIKPNASNFEIANLQEKLRLKREILEIVKEHVKE